MVAHYSHLLLCTGACWCWWLLLLLLVLLHALGCCCCHVYQPVSHEGSFSVCSQTVSNTNTAQQQQGWLHMVTAIAVSWTGTSPGFGWRAF
jgi:hypothetical protein